MAEINSNLNHMSFFSRKTIFVNDFGISFIFEKIYFLELTSHLQRLDKNSNSGGATFNDKVNFKVIFEIPGGPFAVYS